MEMHPVTSTRIHAVGHDGKALFIQFRTKQGAPGPTYRYDSAGAEHHEALRGSESPGRYFEFAVNKVHAGELVGG